MTHERPRCLFCGGDADEPDHLLRCDGRQGHVEARVEAEPVVDEDLDDVLVELDDEPLPHGVTRSTEEAMRVLRRYRQELILSGRAIAVELARKEGTVHTHRVRAEMIARGLLDAGGPKAFWLGAVFRDAAFRWTGDYFTYSDAVHNVHERTIKIWKLVA